MSSTPIEELPHIILVKEAPQDLEVDDESSHTTLDANVETTAKRSLPVAAEEPRRRHEGVYMIAAPTDPTERSRLNLQHLLFRATLSDKLFAAPIRGLDGGVHNVLDFATGTGIWAAEFADQFPAANVIGTDLSLPNPKGHPPNCHFSIKDAEQPWDFPHQFDYIHGRALAVCFKSHFDVIKSAFSALRPGGYLELQDCIVPLHAIDETFKDTRLENWAQHMMKASRALGTDWTRVAKYRQYLEEAGFVDVVEKRFEWPLGLWAKGERMKVLGELYKDDLLGLLEPFSMTVMTRGLRMSVDEVRGVLQGVREEIMSNAIHVYVPVVFVYGRKPV